MSDALVERLRRAGCVFAEDEAAALRGAAPAAWRRERLLRRREAGEPLEQVVGRVSFGGASLRVTPGVFVPRQRTLLLAGLAVRAARSQPSPLVVEAFAGVAPVASAVARDVPAARVHVTDLDPRALRTARRNLPAGAGVHRGDVLDGLPAGLRGRVTLLAAVAPYVPDGAAGLLPREARDHEPAAALLGGPDGLDHVRRLLDAARAWLAPGGRVLLEMHHTQLAAAAAHARSWGRPSRHVGADRQTGVLELRATEPMRHDHRLP